ncbi:MAG: NUDIX domain-containing protein, partial [Candidatus Thermoplasmatota archaeon]|nr:NUDIX domain-containing protein [Candidatus Thermoplasmatota archaeon]
MQIPRDERGITTIKSKGEIFDENSRLNRIKKRNIEEKFATAAIIRKHNKILIARRKKDSFLEPNKWEFPGGKVEPNETYEECVIREIKEELGITISIDKLFLKTTHIYMKNNQIININLIIYLADWVDGEVKN